MKSKHLVFISLIVAFVAPALAFANNSCVTCHEGLTSAKIRGHDFGEWRQSAHAMRGVTCDQCHRGNAQAADKQAAHQGVIPSTQRESPLYFNQIPETCGGCHSAELSEFKKSYHYSELKRSGKGPNCLTCHSAMATTILEPAQLTERCALCHGQRGIANEALVTLKQAAAAVEKWRQAILASGKDASTDDSFKKQAAALDETRKHWHAFDMNSVLKEAKAILSIARTATQGLKLKGAQ